MHLSGTAGTLDPVSETTSAADRPEPISRHPVRHPRDPLSGPLHLTGNAPAITLCLLAIIPPTAAITGALLHPAVGWVLLAVCLAYAAAAAIPPIVLLRHRRQVPHSFLSLDLHWRDWQHAATALGGEDQRTLDLLFFFYAEDSTTRRPPLNLRYALDVARASKDEPFSSLTNREDLSGTASLTRAGMTAEDQITSMIRHRMRPVDTLRLFADVPDLTMPDLRRFLHSDILTPTYDGPDYHRVRRERADRLRQRYAAHGQRASHYAALGLSEEQQRQMTAEEFPLDSLTAMTALLDQTDATATA